MISTLQWTKENNQHFTQFPTDFLIEKQNGYWTLTYTDYWTIKGKEIYVRTSGSFGERYSIKELKQLAETEFSLSK